MNEKKNIARPIPIQQKNFFGRLFPEESNGKNPPYFFLILVFYSLAAFIGISKHEMWRDELEPWLVGSCSESLSDFFHNMKMGSNPYIWYLILHFISKITLNPVIVQIAHISFAIGAVYLFLRFAPFSILKKLLFCLGYYIVYEYGIISRGYALTIFFLFLFCVMYKKYWSAAIPLAVVIFFLANAAGGFGAILSISLLVFLLANYYFNEMSDAKKKQKIKYTGWAAAIILFSIWVAMKSISPPPDSVYATKWFTEFDSDRFIKILCRVWSGFIPVPVLSEVQFWNTNIVNHGDVTGITKNFLAISSLLFLAVNTLIFSRKVAVLLFYLAGTFGILLFSYLQESIFYINASRYHGFLYILFIISLWLLQYFPEKKKVSIPLLTTLSEKLKVNKYQRYVLTFFLSVNVLAGAIAYWKDFKYQFSAVEKTGKYIIENNLQRYPAAGFIDYTVSPISAYTRKPFYYPERDITSTFPIWTLKNYTTDMNQAMNRMLTRISKTNDTFLVVLNFDLNTSLIGDIQFSRLADFKESIVGNETFSVFLASKYNLANNLSSNASLTDEKINNYIGLVNTLLQQNKLEDCEKILTKIKGKTSEKPTARFHNCMGMLYVKKNMPAEAKKEFQKEIDLNLQQEEAYFQLGMLYYNEQKSDSAIFAWEKTISLNPTNIDAYSNLGVCYLNFRKDMDKAEEYWNKTVQLNPDYLQGYLNLMILCQNKKEDDCMLKYLHIVLQKGISVDEIRKRGIAVSDELLKKATT